MPVKVVILVLFGLFHQADGHDLPSTFVLGFDTVEHCEAGYKVVEEKAKEQPEVTAFGHACVEVSAEPLHTLPV